MKKILSLLAAFVLFLSSANAIVYQKIYLKNGSVLNGFIQYEDALGKLKISTDNAIICLKNANADVSHSDEVAYEKLSKEWQDWAEKNDAFIGVGSERKLVLYNIRAFSRYGSDAVAENDSISIEESTIDFETRLKNENRSFNNVRLLEKGETIKFLEIGQNIYTITWADIMEIKSEKRAKNVLSGLRYTYYLGNNRQVSGEYVGETATTINLYNEGGFVESINHSEIKRQLIVPINPNQSIFEQSPLLNVVKLRDNSDIRGIITEMNFSSTRNEENFVTVQCKGQPSRHVRMSEAKSFVREVNPDYKPIVDIILKDGEVVVNRNPVDFVKINEVDGRLQLDSLSKKVVVKKEPTNKTHIGVEYKSKSKVNVERFRLVKVMKAKVSDEFIYYITKRDIDSAYPAISVETSVNQTTKVEYIVGGQGVFLLYDANSKTGIPVIVK